MQHYGSSYIKGLITLFPNIGLDESKFAIKRSMIYCFLFLFFFFYQLILLIVILGFFWNDVNNRRDFFIKIASKNHLDPLSPETWYNINSTSILNEKVPFIINSSSSSLLLLIQFLIVFRDQAECCIFIKAALFNH